MVWVRRFLYAGLFHRLLEDLVPDVSIAELVIRAALLDFAPQRRVLRRVRVVAQPLVDVGDGFHQWEEASAGIALDDDFLSVHAVLDVAHGQVDEFADASASLIEHPDERPIAWIIPGFDLRFDVVYRQ